jgi:hypothetical protein
MVFLTIFQCPFLHSLRNVLLAVMTNVYLFIHKANGINVLEL